MHISRQAPARAFQIQCSAVCQRIAMVVAGWGHVVLPLQRHRRVCHHTLVRTARVTYKVTRLAALVGAIVLRQCHGGLAGFHGGRSGGTGVAGDTARCGHRPGGIDITRQATIATADRLQHKAGAGGDDETGAVVVIDGLRRGRAKTEPGADRCHQIFAAGSAVRRGTAAAASPGITGVARCHGHAVPAVQRAPEAGLVKMPPVVAVLHWAARRKLPSTVQSWVIGLVV